MRVMTAPYPTRRSLALSFAHHSWTMQPPLAPAIRCGSTPTWWLAYGSVRSIGSPLARLEGFEVLWAIDIGECIAPSIERSPGAFRDRTRREMPEQRPEG